MHRTTGRYLPKGSGDGRYPAFVPAPLPPDPPLALDPALLAQLESAARALARLDAVADRIPDTALFLYPLVRKEAVLSSQIEGTQSSLSDLLLFEADEAPGVPLDDVREVSNYVAALDHGLARVRAGFPLSLRLLREMHGLLLEGARGQGKAPGEFRRSQVWLGGTRPGDAVFVPPPPEHLPECLDRFERWLHDLRRPQPALIKAALAHVQFETIHPFLDGNGRLGRLLITLLLCVEGALREPVLYLSLHFKANRAEYYDRLGRVRTHGDWEGWLAFFLRGVTSVADEVVRAAERLAALMEEDRARLRGLKRAARTALAVHALCTRRPVLGVPDAERALGLSNPTLNRAFEHLVRLGVLRELTGQRRNRKFIYDRYVQLLTEGTAPIAALRPSQVREVP
jgi:Fic family protein